VSRYQKGKTNLDYTEAKDNEWQWHQLGHMQVCTSLQSDNHASTPPLSFIQTGCHSCCPTNSVKALKASETIHLLVLYPGNPSGLLPDSEAIYRQQTLPQSSAAHRWSVCEYAAVSNPATPPPLSHFALSLAITHDILLNGVA